MQHDALSSESTTLLRSEFRSVRYSALHFYMAISGGIDWNDLYAKVSLLGVEYQALFLFAQGFSFVVLLNVVAAVFIESTIHNGKSDRILMVGSARKEHKEFLDAMRDMFFEMDKHGRGKVSLKELETYFKAPKVGAY